MILQARKNVKYPLSYLFTIDNNEYRRIADEFLDFVYSKLFEHLSIQDGYCFDKALLIKLDLPYDADITAIKKDSANSQSYITRIWAATRKIH